MFMNIFCQQKRIELLYPLHIALGKKPGLYLINYSRLTAIADITPQ